MTQAFCKTSLLCAIAVTLFTAGCNSKEPIASSTKKPLKSETTANLDAADRKMDASNRVDEDPDADENSPQDSAPNTFTTDDVTTDDGHLTNESVGTESGDPSDGRPAGNESPTSPGSDSQPMLSDSRMSSPDAASQEATSQVAAVDSAVENSEVSSDELQPQGDGPSQTESAELASDDGESVEEVSPFRLLLPTTAGPIVVDLDVQIGDQPLLNSYSQRIEQIVEEASDEDGLTWNGLLAHVRDNPQQFGRAQINPQQYRNMIRMYDKNRNSRPDPSEIASFLFRDTGFSGPFRMIGSNYYRQVNRSQSPMFSALDRNGNRSLESDEIDAAYESLSRLDQNGDQRLDVSEITPAAGMNGESTEAWNNRRKSRWGDVAMDLSGYVDWSMVAYSLDEASQSGPFQSGKNAVAQLDQNGDGSIDHDEAKGLLDVPSDLRVRIVFSSSNASSPKIEAQLPVKEPGVAIDATDGGDQVRVSSDQFQLVATVKERRIGRNTIPREAFDMLDANNDGGLDENEIPAAALQEYSFEDLDRDEDGQLSYQEIAEGINPVPPIWSAQVRSRGAETPDAVFAWLDQDQNHVLSTRELLVCAERLKGLTSDQGSIRAVDFPDSFLIQFGRGDPQQDAQLFALSQPSAKRDVKWPRWADSMDANQDGDVSRREFLGRSDQFNQLDRDADGFLSPHDLQPDP